MRARESIITSRLLRFAQADVPWPMASSIGSHHRPPVLVSYADALRGGGCAARRSENCIQTHLLAPAAKGAAHGGTSVASGDTLL